MKAEVHPSSLARSLTHTHVLRAHGRELAAAAAAAAISHSAILFQISRCHDGHDATADGRTTWTKTTTKRERQSDLAAMTE